jgi:hypothetical protein
VFSQAASKCGQQGHYANECPTRHEQQNHGSNSMVFFSFNVESRDPSRVTDAQSGQLIVFDPKVENRSLDDASTRLKEKTNIRDLAK